MLKGLFEAILLAFFGFDVIFAQGMSELLGRPVTSNAYYAIFAIIGAIVDWREGALHKNRFKETRELRHESNWYNIS